MSDTQNGAWFYTREGERLGPVSFADLRIKAAEGGLNPRLDMAWTQGMGEWKPAGEIEGLFERRASSETRESLAPPAGSYKAPQLEAEPGQMGKDDGWPGSRRRSYLFMTLIFPGLWGYGLGAGTDFLTAQLGPEVANVAIPALYLLPLLLVVAFSISRLANLGMSRWWFLGNLIPLLNVWLWYRCFACPAGYAYHKKLDGIGIFLALIYWLSVLIVILAMAGLVALLFGAIGSPENQDQIREVLRSITEAINTVPASKP
jgi:uncharacterized membrane protein YhaH (DUF805 family)